MNSEMHWLDSSTKKERKKEKGKCATYPSKQWATVRTHFLAMRTQPQMCPLGSLCSEHCHGHLPGRLVRPPRILLYMRAAGRRPQSTKEQERVCDWVAANPRERLSSLRSRTSNQFSKNQFSLIRLTSRCYAINVLTLFSTQKRNPTGALTGLPTIWKHKQAQMKLRIYLHLKHFTDHR